MNTEDDEFNRIEMEQRVRATQQLPDEFPSGIPFVTQDELERLRRETE